MVSRGVVAATAGFLALWATNGSAAGDEVIPLNIKGGAGVAIFTHDHDTDADIELTRRRGGFSGGFRFGYGGGYYGGRGYYGGGYGRGYYGGGYARGYYGGHYRSYAYRPFYGGYHAGYRDYYYPRYYYPRVYISAGYYQPYYGGYYYGPSYYNDYYYDPYCPLNGDSGHMPYAHTLGGNASATTQYLRPNGVAQPPAQTNGTYRYDGGPGNLVPLPGRTEPAPTSRPTAPAPNTRLVSMPNQPATGFAYPAYGQQPRVTSFASDPQR